MKYLLDHIIILTFCRRLSSSNQFGNKASKGVGGKGERPDRSSDSVFD